MIINLVIQTIEKENYIKAHLFQCEYLDNESFNVFLKRVESNPGLYLIAMDDEELVGVCYGSPSRKDEQAIQLQGIAVNLDVKKRIRQEGNWLKID